MGKYIYTKTNWIGGKTIGTADVMNNLEEGVYQANERLNNLNIASSSNDSFINVLDYGAKGDGVTDSGKFINDAINYAKANNIGAVYVPKGVYIIETPILIKDDVSFYGDGQNTILRQKNNTEILAVVNYESDFSDNTFVESNYNTTLRDFRIDGNKANNNTYVGGGSLTNNNGLILNRSHWSFITRVVIENCGRDGIILTGTSGDDWNKHCTTNHFTDCSVFKCGRYGVRLEDSANDNHFNNCQIGANAFDNVILIGGSNAFNNCTLWGSTGGHGVYIGCGQTLLRGCNIEGNAQCGVSIDAYGSHSLIFGCKFMSNSRSSENGYNHIYLGGESALPVENINIIGNMFLSSSQYADGDGSTNFCIGMESTHKGITINNNTVYYNNPGTAFNLDKQQIYGLQEFDVINNVTLINSTSRPSWADYTDFGKLYYEIDTGNLVYMNKVTSTWVTLG